MSNLWAEGDVLSPTNLNTKIQSVITTSITTVVVPSVNTANGVFAVRDYGALGDAATDDTASFTSANAAALAVGGGVVYLSPGTYSISGFTLGSNVILQGTGTASVIKASTTTSPIIVSSSKNWTIRDLLIDGNISAFTVASQFPTITLVSATSGLVYNVSIISTIWDGINGIACGNVRVEQCSISSTSQHGILFGNNPSATPSRFINVASNFIQKTNDVGIFYYAEIRDSTIADNILNFCDNGIRLEVIDPNSAQSVERIALTGNVVTGCKTDGIRLMGSEIACVGNVSSNNSNSGIRTGGSAGSDVGTFVRSSIVGNSCSSNSNIGIGVIDRAMDFITIAGNTVTRNRGQGIAFGSLNSSAGTIAGATIVGNTCNRNGFNGISFSDHTFIYAMIANNVCSNNGWNGGGNGINLDSTLFSTIQGNNCYDNQSTKSQQIGISITSSSDSCTIMGNFTRDVDHAVSGTSIVGSNHELNHNIV